MGQVDYVKVNSAPSIASLQVEGTAKLENAVTFTTGVAPVKTIATWIPMTRQAMEDQGELMGYINVALPYYVNKREEVEFLFGGGGSTDINGIYTQATALQTALALPAYNKSDLIAAAIQQIQIATEIEPTFVVLHPTDYWQILRTKDANRSYIFGNNGITVDPFWGLTPIRTIHMGSGDFLVGSGSPGGRGNSRQDDHDSFYLDRAQRFLHFEQDSRLGGKKSGVTRLSRGVVRERTILDQPVKKFGVSSLGPRG